MTGTFDVNRTETFNPQKLKRELLLRERREDGVLLVQLLRQLFAHHLSERAGWSRRGRRTPRALTVTRNRHMKSLKDLQRTPHMSNQSTWIMLLTLRLPQVSLIFTITNKQFYTNSLFLHHTYSLMFHRFKWIFIVFTNFVLHILLFYVFMVSFYLLHHIHILFYITLPFCEACAVQHGTV